jgi:hypothetical protein
MIAALNIRNDRHANVADRVAKKQSEQIAGWLHQRGPMSSGGLLS